MTREEAINWFKTNPFYHSAHEPFNMAIKALSEPEPKTGHWIHRPDQYLEDESVYECSECGEPWIFLEGTPEDNHANFCPNCGRRLLEVKNEKN